MVVLQQDRDRAGIGVVIDAEVTCPAQRRVRCSRRAADRVIVEAQEAAVAEPEGLVEMARRHLQAAGDGAEHSEAKRFAPMGSWKNACIAAWVAFRRSADTPCPTI